MDTGTIKIDDTRAKRLQQWRDYYATHRAAHAARSRARRKAKRDELAKARRRYCQKYPEKLRAQCKVYYAIKTGQLSREPCEHCGDEYAEAHHDDYGRALGVRWLCPTCHRRHHCRMPLSPVKVLK